SEQYDYFVGKNEKEIKIISEEIRVKKKLHSQSNTVTARMIANFIRESEIIEETLRDEILDVDIDKNTEAEEGLINDKTEVTSSTKNKVFKSEIFGELI